MVLAEAITISSLIKSSMEIPTVAVVGAVALVAIWIGRMTIRRKK